MFHINGRKCENSCLFCNCVKQNVVFLNKMFHTKGARWRLVPYVILEGRSPDRIQTSIKKGSQRCGPFCVWWGRNPPGFSPFGSSAHPHCGLQTPARNAWLITKNVRVFIFTLCFRKSYKFYSSLVPWFFRNLWKRANRSINICPLMVG